MSEQTTSTTPAPLAELALVTEFLEIVGIAADGAGTGGAGASQDDLDDRKAALKARFQDRHQKNPAHAGQARIAALDRLRTQFANAIGGRANADQVSIAGDILERMDAEADGVEADLERNAATKAALKADFTPDKLGGTPEGTGADRTKRLEQLQTQFSNQLGGPPTDDQLALIQETHAALKAEHAEAVKDAALVLQEKRDGAAKRLGALVKPGATPEQVVPGATADDVAAAIKKAGEVAALIPAAGFAAFKGIDEGIVAVGTLVTDAGKVVQRRAGERDRLVAAAKDVGVPALAEAGELDALGVLRGKVGGAMTAPLTDAMLGLAKDAFDALEKEKKRLDGLGVARQERHDKLADDLAKVERPAGLPDQVERLGLLRGKVETALKLPVSDAANRQAGEALQALRDDVAAVKEELAALGGLEGVDALCLAVGVDRGVYAALETSLGGRKAMGGVLAAFPPQQLGELCKAAGDGQAGIAGVGKLLQAYKPDELKTVTANLGGAANLGALVRHGLDGAAIKTLGATLGGAKTVAALMASGGAATPVALAKALGDKPKPLQDFSAAAGLNGKPQAIAELFLRGCKGDPQKFVALTDALKVKGADAKMKALTEGGGLGAQPAVLGELLAGGCGGDPRNMLALGGAFEGKANDAARKKLANLVANGGFAATVEPPQTGADPGCLGALLQHGAKDPKDFNAKVTSFKKLVGDVPNMANLKGVMDEGGLGRQPEVLGHLVGIGCGGDGKQLGMLATKFSGKPARENLAKLVGAGGLAPSVKKVEGKPDEVVVDPRCLGQLLQSGVGDAGTATFDTKAGGLLTLANGLGDTGRANLKGLVEGGGLGREPEVLGHMVGAGCMGDPAKLNALTAALTGEPARTGMSGMLKEGGLGRQGVAPGVAADPRCLAALFETGCSGDPAALKDLVTGLTPAQLKEVGTVVQAGSLGKHPDVLANLYRFGCLSDPKDDASAQSPAALASFAKGLQGNEPKLKGLLDDGGFGNPGYPRVLGQVMRDAFPGPAPNGSAKLAGLHDAFADSTAGNAVTRAAANKTELAKLSTMMEAFSTYPANVSDVAENPGVALDNVLTKANLPMNKLKTSFYARLDTRSRQAGHVANDAHMSASYGVPKLNKKELLQNAATLRNFAPGTEMPGNLPNNRWTCDTNHVNWRHTREHLNLNGSGLDPNKVTTLFKAGVGSAKVASMMEESINTVNASTSPLPNDADFYNNGKDWLTRNAVIAGGVRVKMGIKHVPDWRRPNGSWVRNDFDMNQWYPKTGSPGTKTILYGDMDAMLGALRS